MAFSKKQLAAQVIGSAEAAEIIGVLPNTVSSYVARGQILEPLLVLSCGPIWLRDDLKRWQAKRQRI